MTTIAWDGETLAADSRITFGNLPANTIKAWMLADGRIFAGSGTMQETAAVHEWLEAGSPPALKPTGLKNFSGLLIKDGKCYKMEENLVPFIVTDRCHAIGSGSEFAIAAMALGKSASDAVEFAMKFDVATGGTITAFRSGKPVLVPQELPPAEPKSRRVEYSFETGTMVAR